jgi:hypothetical protein
MTPHPTRRAAGLAPESAALPSERPPGHSEGNSPASPLAYPGGGAGPQTPGSGDEREPSPLPGRTFTLEFPPGMEILTGNNRLSRYPKARVTKALREQGWAQAKRLKLPRLERAEICVTYLPPPRRVQDRHPLASARIEDGENLGPTSKALIDGIVSAGVFASDSRKHVRRVSNELLDGTCPRGQVVLHIVEVAP